RGVIGELPQVHLARLVGAVLAPHHAVHRELGVGGTPAEDVADLRVLVVLQPELGVWLLGVGRVLRGLDGVQVGHAATSACTAEANIASPSSLGPVNESIACSG